MDYVIDDRSLPDDVCLLTARGQLDVYAMPVLNEHVNRAFTRHAKQLIVELADGSYIDSMMIGVMLSAHRRMLARGGTLELVCADPSILRIFELVGLTDRLHVYHALIDALAAPDLG